MKYSDKKANKLIDRYASVNIIVSFRSEVDDSWELERHPADRPYKVYIRYDDPREVEMAVVSDPEYARSLTREEKQGIANDEAFSFKFMALITELEDMFGDLPLPAREYIAKRSLEKL